MVNNSILLWTLLAFMIFCAELFYPYLENQFYSFCASSFLCIFLSVLLPFYIVCLCFLIFSTVFCVYLNFRGSKKLRFSKIAPKALIVSKSKEEYKILYEGKLYNAKSDVKIMHNTGDVVKIVSRKQDHFEFSTF